MDVQHMRYVLEIARTGSVRTAATGLFISPQSLSEQLRRVERTVGAPLFTRTTTGMVLTEIGQVFVAHAADAVSAFDRAELGIRAEVEGSPVEIHLAWAYGLADVLQDLLRLLVIDSPGQPVRVTLMGCVAQRDALSHGQITAGLSHHWSGTPPQPGVHHLVVDSARPRALLPARHPLGRRASVTLADLAREPLLLPAESGTHCLREWELAEFGRHALTPRLGTEVSSIDVAVARTAAGDGYALCVPPTHPIGPDLLFVPLADDLSPLLTTLIWSHRPPPVLMNAARRLVNGVRERVRPD